MSHRSYARVTWHHLRSFVAICLCCGVMATRAPAETTPGGAVQINSQFAGGNVLVERNEGASVHVAPDLRGDSPWFYWCFEAKATRPGRVHFVFPEKVAGFKNGAIGFQGPAISTDQGMNWQWLGTERVRDNVFYHDFAQVDEAVRFAVTIPYVQSNLEQFLRSQGENPHLRQSVLTKSRHGRSVELLQIGEPGPGVKAVLVTGRHHAAETIASYVLEGFLRAAMSEEPAGQEFRKKYVLFAVPFVDKDGVEEGDQGKNRKPHDHNRDYGEQSIYPEIRAIRDLHDAHHFQLTLDFHCPTLVMEDHQVFYFVGAKDHPANNFEHVSEFARRIKTGLPKQAPFGPLVWLKPASTPIPMNSHYFGFQPGMIMAATLEIPFAPKGKATDAASCRKYGEVVLRAWVDTPFADATVR
jgi:hypothetical protein